MRPLGDPLVRSAFWHWGCFACLAGNLPFSGSFPWSSDTKLNHEQARTNREGSRTNRERAQMNHEGSRTDRERARMNREGSRTNRERAQMNREGGRTDREQARMNSERSRRNREPGQKKHERCRTSRVRGRRKPLAAQARHRPSMFSALWVLPEFASPEGLERATKRATSPANE